MAICVKMLLRMKLTAVSFKYIINKKFPCRIFRSNHSSQGLAVKDRRICFVLGPFLNTGVNGRIQMSEKKYIFGHGLSGWGSYDDVYKRMPYWGMRGGDLIAFLRGIFFQTIFMGNRFSILSRFPVQL